MNNSLNIEGTLYNQSNESDFYEYLCLKIVWVGELNKILKPNKY